MKLFSDEKHNNNETHALARTTHRHNQTDRRTDRLKIKQPSYLTNKITKMNKQMYGNHIFYEVNIFS